MRRVGRTRFSCLAFLVFFVSLQTFGIAHASKYGNQLHRHDILITQPDEHGVEPHTHSGEICEIFLLGEKTKFADLSLADGLRFLAFNEERRPILNNPQPNRIFHKGAYARAPPATFLS